MKFSAHGLVMLAATVLLGGLSTGCSNSEVPLSTQAPQVKVEPPPPALTKPARPDGKNVRPPGGS